MVGLVEVAHQGPVNLGFSVAHQKVELDIDLLSRSLKGKTEITISPHSKDLKAIRLNLRQCQVTRLTVNGRWVTSMFYDDPYKHVSLPWQAGVHQHHMLREKIDGQLRSPPQEELVVNLPRNVKIDEVDANMLDTITVERMDSLHGKRNSGDILETPVLESPITKALMDQRYTPITVYAEWIIEDVRDGMHFVGWQDGDLRYPHAYTRTSTSKFASCLFPCLDNTSSRNSWEISITCPKTVGDALQRVPQYGKGAADRPPNASGKVSQNLKVAQSFSNFSDEELALDLTVVCSGDLTDEIVDAVDQTRKTTSFTCTANVAAQHIGFAVGPFEHIDLAQFRESDEDEKLGQNAVPVHGFCLPGRGNEVMNTCLPLAKAIDFFTLTYGSFPFASYAVCFVDDQTIDWVHTASVTLCSNRNLFSEDIIESMDAVTRNLIHALATQWIGVNVTPYQSTDTWLIIGIAWYITDIFMKRLSGNNEYRYRQKIAADRVCDLDMARPSIYDMGAIIDLDPSEHEFLTLKAPVVLFILDRILAKANGSFGLSRIISKIFLNAKVGDLENGALTTASFQRICEKLGHKKLDIFFQQWVFGAGCPRFRVSQRFNKKKLVVEILIQQAQADLPSEKDLEKETFMRDVREDLHDVYAGTLQPAFTGPMTIRIHEADGTPYEHTVEIKDATTKFDIPYNTKYKRLKRSRRQKERGATGQTGEFATDGTDEGLVYFLGDVLQTEAEMKDWRLQEWSKEDEDRMGQESYEWIRMDADFEWICKMSITMPGYMYLSQLQQDRDVVAQLESVQYMAAQREHPLVSTILIRTLMDERYFHGIRTAAAVALVKQAKDEVNWVGLYHLERAFQQFFCLSDSRMTQPNDFSDRASYYIQCAIPQAIAQVRDNSGKAPFRARNWLFEKLKFNDNSNNEFSDCHYISRLMTALSESLCSFGPQNFDEIDTNTHNGDNSQFQKSCLDEIDRYRRIDEWIPSYHNVLSTTALDCKRRLAKAGLISTSPAEFLLYTREGCYEELRINAFSNVIELGLFVIPLVTKWFLYALGSDPSPRVRHCLVNLLGRALGLIAIGEANTVPELQQSSHQQQNGLIIEQESSTEARAADIARRQTVAGALAALKRDIAPNAVFEAALWEAIKSPVITINELGQLLEVCSVLYEADSAMLLILKYPRYWTCRNQGRGRLTFYPTGRVRTTMTPKRAGRRKSPPVVPNPSKPKREDSYSNSPNPPRTFLKPPKKPGTSGVVDSSSPGGSIGLISSPVVEEVRPKLTLKLNLKGGFKPAGQKTPGSRP